MREPWAVPPRVRGVFVILVAALFLASGCQGRAAAPVKSKKPPLTYVAVGASETVGTGADVPAKQAWPRVLADTLGQDGRQVTFTNVGYGGATVPDALASSVPKAELLSPNLVTVWLNVNDIIGDFLFSSGKAYEPKLGEMVRRLRRGGATTVLLANSPALERLPAYTECLKPVGARCLVPAARGQFPQPDAVIAKVGEFNRIIAAIAQREGAILVDLYATSLAARANGTEPSLVSVDGFHPSTAGHAAVAAAFAEAARKANV